MGFLELLDIPWFSEHQPMICPLILIIHVRLFIFKKNSFISTSAFQASYLLTILFLSAFWIVYPVMAALPSSFGGFHDKFTFSPHTSSIVTISGGPGRSVMKIWEMTFSIIFVFSLCFLYTFHFVAVSFLHTPSTLFSFSLTHAYAKPNVQRMMRLQNKTFNS